MKIEGEFMENSKKNENKKKSGGLGRGIGALIPKTPEADVPENTVTLLKISQIEPNPNQPRKNFDSEKLRQLSESILKHGVIQPIAVKKGNNGFYTIIAGERRWRAARMAHLSEIPVVVKNVDELAVTELALIENLQREDLNPIEEAQGYRRLLDDFDLTQEEISEKIGKSRSAIANAMRLLNLSPSVLKLVEQLEISSGHARALLALEDNALQEKIAYEIIEKDLSVRQVEKYVKILLSADKEHAVHEPKTLNAAKEALEENLSSRLGTKVKILQKKNKKGKIEIEFYDNDSLQKIVDLLSK